MLSLHSYPHRFRLFFSILVLLGSGILLWGRWSGSNAGTVRPDALSQEQRAPVEAELITATPTGFEPAEIKRLQGRFLLAVDNQTGLDALDLYLEGQTGTRGTVTLNRSGT